MRNYRLAIALLALFIMGSFTFSDASHKDIQSTIAETPSTHDTTKVDSLPPQRVLEVDSVQELMWTVDTCKEGNVTILIADGTYIVPNGLWITGNNITYKSKSGNRDSVILKGAFKTSHIFWISSDYVTIQDLTLGEVNDHGIQILSEKDADHTLVKNVRFYDIKEQMLKASGNLSNAYSDYTRIEGCLFEFTKENAYQSYTGGIDVHKGKNWVVSDNTFRNIQFPKGTLTEGAIHFWDGSTDNLIANNIIENCDRGILLGLDESPHDKGTVINNKITTTKDVGIYLYNATNTTVKNNQVTVPNTYPNAIEFRFDTSGTLIENNTVNKAIRSRNGGKARVLNNRFVEVE